MNTYDIGIVIVNYNVRHFLVQCLQSIRKSNVKGLKIEVWVVDNASVDGSIALIRKEFPEVNVIENLKNAGFSTANNQALRKLNSTYSLLLNPDTVLEEDTLRLCYDFMESHKESGALGVRMIDGSGKFLPESKRKVPDLWSSFCKLFILSDLFPKSSFFSGYNLGHLPENETHEIEVLCGAFMFIRSSVLAKTGLLDEAFFMYGEDIDLSFRIIKEGHKIYYYPETSIIHYKGESTKKSSLNYVRTFYGAMLIYVNKHYTKGNARIFSAFIRFAIILRAILSGIRALISKWISPIIDGILLFIGLKVVELFWASYYFDDATYYHGSAIHLVLPCYTLVWISGLWLSGHYDKPKKWQQSITGFLIGTAFILIAYALLPETLRTSRAIILIGTLLGILLTSFTSWISSAWSFFRRPGDISPYSNIAIVGQKSSAEKLKETLDKAQVNYANIYFINPKLNDQDIFFTNTLEALPKVVKDLKIGEVIYSNEDMTMKEIIQSMTGMDASVRFKIGGGDDSLSIIGSSSKNTKGEFYSLDIRYELSETKSLRWKRIFDILMVGFVILLSPILFFINNINFHFLSNAIKVLLNRKTWVGYGGEPSDYSFLPSIPPAVIKYPLKSGVLNYSDGHFKKMNIQYAKEFNSWTDIGVIRDNIFKLSNQK